MRMVNGRCLWRSRWRMALLVCVPLLVGAIAPAGTLQGDFAGWIFFDDGGDAPLQLHSRIVSGTEQVSFSLPAQSTYAVPFGEIKETEGEYELTRIGKTGQRTVLRGRVEGATFKGEITFGDKANGRFELMRTARPLTASKPALPTHAAGVYRAASRDTILVSTWAWGEPRLLDLSTGTDRTLFAVGDGEWIAGSSLYTAASEEARLMFRDRGVNLTRPGSAAATAYARVDLRDEVVTFRSGDVNLEGTLTLPGAGPHPAVVILGGSDVTLRGHVRQTAEIFAGLGVAAFAFDLRGYGASGGAKANSITTAGKDACAAIRALARRRDIDKRRIGLFGSSRGGWIAPAAARRCGADVGFVILFAAPVVSPQDQLTRYRLQLFNRAMSGAAERKAAAQYVDLTWRSFESDADWARYEQARKEIEGKGWLGILEGPPSRASDDYAWLRLNRAYDPMPALTSTRAPTLAGWGEFDVVVNPADSRAKLESALKRAGNRDVTTFISPNANHGLTLVDPQHPYDGVPVHRVLGYEPTLWRRVRQWLVNHRIV